jgi:AcrR family transcriptional regulator
MRDLAQELNVSTMAAYHHIRNKDELLTRVGNAIWGAVEIPRPDTAPWHERLRYLVVAERDATKDYPGLYEELRHLVIFEKATLEDAQFDTLSEAGYSPARAVVMFRTLRSWINGNAYLESALRDPGQRHPPASWLKAQRLTFDHSIVPAKNADDYFLEGLDLLLAGMRATPPG